MTPRRETVIGAGVLGALVLALALNALGSGQRGAGDGGYAVQAVFHRTDGLTVGAQVRLAGLPVGQVVEQVLDARYRAHVTLRLNEGVQLPQDSSAIIETDGLLGAKYIELQPGADDDMLGPGGRIEYTQDSMMIEELLARVVAQAKARLAPASAGAEGAGGGETGTTGNSFIPSMLDDPSLQGPSQDRGE